MIKGKKTVGSVELFSENRVFMCLPWMAYGSPNSWYSGPQPWPRIHTDVFRLRNRKCKLCIKTL